jgi:O-antigen ligase
VLLIWAENGTLGLAAYLAFLVSTARLLWKTWRAQIAGISPLALGLLSGLAANTVGAMFQVARGRVELQLLVIIAALAGSLTVLANKTSNYACGAPNSKHFSQNVGR